MAKYPEWNEIQWDFPLDVELESRVLTSQFDGLGKEKRRLKFLQIRRNIRIRYEDRFLTREKVTTLWQFFQARNGPFEAFSFFHGSPGKAIDDYELNNFVDEYIGVGDGSTTGFDLPCKNIQSNPTVYYRRSGAKNSYNPTDYEISGEMGADSADRINFDTAPLAGDVLSIDFRGTLKTRCRFANQVASFQDFYNILGTIGLELKGLLNDE